MNNIIQTYRSSQASVAEEDYTCTHSEQGTFEEVTKEDEKYGDDSSCQSSKYDSDEQYEQGQYTDQNVAKAVLAQYI